jgi:hypothetical protein
MKKILAISVALATALTLSGCGSNSQVKIDEAIQRACQVFKSDGSWSLAETENGFGALARIAPQYQPIADIAIEAVEMAKGGGVSFQDSQTFIADEAKLRAFCSGVKKH